MDLSCEPGDETTPRDDAPTQARGSRVKEKMTLGSLALVGSGEYSATMLELERLLIESAHKKGKTGGFVQLATAAGLESDSRIQYWKDLGRAQAERIGVEWIFLDIKNREDALSRDWSDEFSGASLIYFSGGNPHHLADSFRDTPVWSAIVSEFASGASLAGCSAGAMFMGSNVPDFKGYFGKPISGVNLLPGLSVLPHYDRFFGRLPAPLRKFLEHVKDDSLVVGVDENTAMYCEAGTWRHYGVGKVHLLRSQPEETYSTPGEIINFPISINIG